MSRFTITASMRGAEARYMYEDAAKALKKARALANKAIPFILERSDGEKLNLDQLEAMVRPK